MVALDTIVQAERPTAIPPLEGYSRAVGYLRAFVTLLVVAHHAVLAYHQFAPAPPADLTVQPQLWPVFPVVDSQRWPGFTLLVAFNDIFFMSLMFLLSGLFVSASVRRKGSGRFLRDRALRLGVPFILSAAILAPLAYYPSYLGTTGTPGLADFARQWMALEFWPAGPAWFLWVLLAFDAIAAALFAIAPPARLVPRPLICVVSDRPWTAFALLVTASTLAYVPMAVTFTPMHWTLAGPFAIQTGRAVHYALYFGVGVALGAATSGQGLLAPDGPLSRRRLTWIFTALVSFAVALVLGLAGLSQPDSVLWVSLAGLGFALSCAASCFALLAVFLRVSHRRSALWESLRANAYGIYLVHYALVTWLQYSLLDAELTGLAKGTLVFISSATISWCLVAALRRLPAFGRVI